MIKKLPTLALVVFSGIACCKTPGVDNFQALSEKTCVPLSASSVKHTLPNEWQPYLSSSKVCPLIKTPGAKSAIVLISVSLEDATRNKSPGDAWDKLPKPIFFNEKGQCVARLPYLFPDDPPFGIQLSYGQWQGLIPGEIRLHVQNQAVEGDFDLPTLTWNTKIQSYVPVGEFAGKEKELMRCP